MFGCSLLAAFMSSISADCDSREKVTAAAAALVLSSPASVPATAHPAISGMGGRDGVISCGSYVTRTSAASRAGVLTAAVDRQAALTLLRVMRCCVLLLCSRCWRSTASCVCWGELPQHLLIMC
jgi:hypothetical protein